MTTENRVRSTDQQPQHGPTCSSDHSGCFQRRCTVNVISDITTLWRNDVPNVDRKNIMAEPAETLEPVL